METCFSFPVSHTEHRNAITLLKEITNNIKNSKLTEPLLCVRLGVTAITAISYTRRVKLEILLDMLPKQC